MPWEQSTLSHVLNCAEKKDTPQGAYNSTVQQHHPSSLTQERQHLPSDIGKGASHQKKEHQFAQLQLNIGIHD